ncbi:MAG: DUF2867 domain-containing protein [Desulfobacterales bacterium]|nr:DUF2867 domain-containing protein [Desulfobacterales bacterium]
MSSASPKAIWEQITAIGGNNRYYYLNCLWTLREFLDWLLGGPGLNRGRRHPTELRLGDTIDSWKVIGLEPQQRLTLLFGMKAPGSGVLEFEVTPEPTGLYPHHGYRLLASRWGVGTALLVCLGAGPSVHLQGPDPCHCHPR